MTFQEAFDKVLTAMRQRGYKRAVGSLGFCVMCAQDGTQCAIGILADAKYGEPESAVVERVRELFPHYHLRLVDGFLVRMQSAHDEAVLPALFEGEMRRLANLHDLVYQAP